MAWELIDHTGDVGMIARAPTLEELFAESARAMFAILVEPGPGTPSGTDSFPVAGSSPEEELRDFLSELLYRFSADRRMYVSFTAGQGKVDAAWETYDPGHHPLRTELKAVTYHQLEVVREGAAWRGRVIFDV
jgi:SHS2 domain-containing protein